MLQTEIISLEGSPFICFGQRLSPLKHLPLYASDRDYLPWSISLYLLHIEIISLEASPFICFRQRLSPLKHLPDRDYLPWSISLYMLRTEIISLNAHRIGVLLKLCKVSSILVYPLIRRTCGYETKRQTDRVITIYPLHHHLKILCFLVYLLIIHIQTGSLNKLFIFSSHITIQKALLFYPVTLRFEFLFCLSLMWHCTANSCIIY